MDPPVKPEGDTGLVAVLCVLPPPSTPLRTGFDKLRANQFVVRPKMRWFVVSLSNHGWRAG